MILLSPHLNPHCPSHVAQPFCHVPRSSFLESPPPAGLRLRTLVDHSNKTSRSAEGSNRSSRTLVVAQAWKTRDTQNVEGRSKALLVKLTRTDGTREEVTSALDSWAAFQQDFPLLATKNAMQELRRRGEWARLTLVCKWLLEKGQGRTFGTYSVLLEAMARLGRDEEMDLLWDLILEENLETVPRVLFQQVMTLYSERQRPMKILETYGSMESCGLRLDETTMDFVTTALNSVGAPKLAEKIVQEYSNERKEWRYSNGKRKQVKSFGKEATGEGVFPNTFK